MSEPKNNPEPESNDTSKFEEVSGHHDWWQDILDIFKEADFVPAQVHVRDTDDGPWREVDISDEDQKLTPEPPVEEKDAQE